MLKVDIVVICVQVVPNIDLYVITVGFFLVLGEKEHVCTTCGKAFSNARVLKTHMNIHTGSRPFTCDICLRTFTHYSALATHRKTQHSNETVHNTAQPTFSTA